MKWVRCYISKPIISLIVLPLLITTIPLYPKNSVALSTDAETEMGRQFVLEVKRYFEILDDDFANQYFGELGRFLIASLDTRPFPFNFYIIKDKTMNAFAGPGGHIFFFSGLIDSMDRVDELAAILCHEIGHVSARHMANRIEQSRKISLATFAGILAGVLIGGEAARAIMVGSMAGGIQARLHYSRNDERQADQLGYKYMTDAGFDPRGLISTLVKIEKSHYMGSNRTPAYLLTHPTGPERMSNLDVMLSNYSPKKPGEKAMMFIRNFPMFQTVVRAKCLDPQISKQLFKRELEKDPDSELSHFGLGLVYMEEQEYKKAITHFKAAQEGSLDSIPVLINLGKAYQSTGENKKAISVLKKAMATSYEDVTVPYLLGLSYENLKQYEKAIAHFERLTNFKPVNEDVYKHLGISYGKLDNLLYAHYNLGIYCKMTGEMGQADFHFQKALELSQKDPKMRDKIEKERKGLPQNR